MKEVKIRIPDNCVLIKEGSTYIVEEQKQTPPRSWEEFCKRYPIKKGEAYIDTTGTIISADIDLPGRAYRNWCTSEEEAEAFLALMQLRQLRKAWVGNWDYSVSAQEHIPTIMYIKGEGIVIRISICSHALSFPTEEMAEAFLKCFRSLCETAKPLL